MTALMKLIALEADYQCLLGTASGMSRAQYWVLFGALWWRGNIYR